MQLHIEAVRRARALTTGSVARYRDTINSHSDFNIESITFSPFYMPSIKSRQSAIRSRSDIRVHSRLKSQTSLFFSFFFKIQVNETCKNLVADIVRANGICGSEGKMFRNFVENKRERLHFLMSATVDVWMRFFLVDSQDVHTKRVQDGVRTTHPWSHTQENSDVPLLLSIKI